MKVFLIINLIIISTIIISYINHRINIKKENKILKPLGEIVEVNGSNMSVYTKGSGQTTLVFMSGGGTCSPILDFKSLYTQFEDEYKIVVIEKFGYGFSDIIDKKRDIDSILEDSRTALFRAGICEPYILCPHSMSGIEALYWAQKYPKEIQAIIGLDIVIPNVCKDYPVNITLLNVISFLSKSGITRLIPKIAESEAVKFGTLNNHEKEIYKYIFYRRTLTKTMINEVCEIKNNSLIVSNGSEVDIPMLMFCSNGKGTGFAEEKWKEYQHEYANQIENRQIINLKCSHYVHNYEYKKIAKDIKSFIKHTL